MRKKSGQILILVLLIVVVALAVGLSIASRNITNLRTSTQTEQSQRAFSAAEGGVEDVLSNLSTIASNPNIGSSSGVDLSVPVGDITANVNVKGSNVYESIVEEGTVAQVDTSGYGGAVTVEWIVVADSSENTSPKASIEVSFVCQNASCFGTPGTGGSYSQHRRAFQAENIAGQDNFTQCTPNPPGDKYLCRADFSLAAGDNVLFMRIRPFWKKTTIRVTGGASFPLQTYDVVSTASTELGLTRRVQVTRTALPQLPAAFDYVLFSESDISK